MEEKTFQKVTEHMNTARQSIKDARRAVEQAILTMTDTEGVNLPFTNDIKHTLTQLLERFDIWKAGPLDTAPTPELRQIGDLIQLTGTIFVGEIRAIYPDYEESGETAYAVRMPQDAVDAGYLPIEVLSSHLLDVPNT